MAINYSNPQLQRMRLRAVASQPWGGTRGRVPGINEYFKEMERRRLSLADVGLRSQLNRANIEQMGFERGMAEKKLGLGEGYLDIARAQMDIANRTMGIRESEFGIKSQLQNLAERTSSWRHQDFLKNLKLKEDVLKDKEDELDMSTWLGLGTSAYAGYEGYRRAQKEKEMSDYYKKLAGKV